MSYETTRLKQIRGGTVIKQNDTSSVLQFELLDYKGDRIESINDKEAVILLHNYDSVVYRTTSIVKNESVSFRIDRPITDGKYSIEISCDGYVFPSNNETKIEIKKSGDSILYDVTNISVDIRQKISDIESKLLELNSGNAGGVSVSDNTLLERLRALEERPAGSYDDSEITRKIGVLETELQQISTKQDNDTVYDDTEIKREISVFNSRVDEIVQSVTTLNEIKTNTSAPSGKVTINKTNIEYRLTDNQYISNTNGQPTAFAAWSMTDYIDLLNSDLIAVVSTNSSIYNAWYNAEKQFVKSFNLGASINLLEKPENARYIRISDHTAHMNRLKIECWKFENRVTTSSESYDDTQVRNLISGIDTRLQAVESRRDNDTIYNDSGLRTRIATLENSLKIMTQELEKLKSSSGPTTPITHTVNIRPAKAPLVLEDLEFTNNTDRNLFTIGSDNIFKKTAIQDFKTRILFKEDIKEYDVTTIRNGQWFIIGYNEKETIVFGAFGHDNTSTGKISLIDNITHRITELINPNNLLTYFPRGYDRIRLGDKLRFKINDDGTELLIQKMYNDVYEDFFKLTPNSHVTLTEKRFNRLGICVGVSSSENSGSIMNNIMKDVMVYRKPKEDKYAIFVVAGQSNAVGYDESIVEHEAYTEDPRIFQLGQYGENKNKIIPLGKFAETYQNMTSFTADGKGTKGIHLPLAKKLLADVPEDYKILVISASYGDTGFRTGGLGTYNSMEDIPTTSLMWSTESAYYKSMVERTKHALDMNPENKFLGVIWIQGEHDGGANTATNHGVKFSEMADKFISDMQPYVERAKNSVINKNNWINVQSTHYWSVRGQYLQVLENYKTWNMSSFVPISTTSEHTNATNGTGRTSSNRDSHFGNNAYATLVAPAVYDKMKELDII